mgnify:CR=1 FL=1
MRFSCLSIRHNLFTVIELLNACLGFLGLAKTCFANNPKSTGFEILPSGCLYAIVANAPFELFGETGRTRKLNEGPIQIDFGVDFACCDESRVSFPLMLGCPRRLGFLQGLVILVPGFPKRLVSGDDAIAVVSSSKFASAAVWSMTDGQLPSLKIGSDEGGDMMFLAAIVPSAASVLTITAFSLAMHSQNVKCLSGSFRSTPIFLRSSCRARRIFANRSS